MVWITGQQTVVGSATYNNKTVSNEYYQDWFVNGVSVGSDHQRGMMCPFTVVVRIIWNQMPPRTARPPTCVYKLVWATPCPLHLVYLGKNLALSLHPAVDPKWKEDAGAWRLQGHEGCYCSHAMGLTTLLLTTLVATRQKIGQPGSNQTGKEKRQREWATPASAIIRGCLADCPASYR